VGKKKICLSKTFPCPAFMITESSKGAFHHYNSTPAASITGVATVLSLKTHLNMFTNDIIPRSFPDIYFITELWGDCKRGKQTKKPPKLCRPTWSSSAQALHRWNANRFLQNNSHKTLSTRWPTLKGI